MTDSEMNIEQAIVTRRTHKAYQPQAVSRAILDELFDLARWAPNHHLTNPWRFRVLGAQTLLRLKAIAEAQEPGSAGKLDRAPTLVLATARLCGDQIQQKEDLLAGGIAAYIVLLAAHGKGLAGYWRTPQIFETSQGRAALQLASDETVLGLLHLGYPREEQRVPERAPVSEIVSYLD